MLFRKKPVEPDEQRDTYRRAPDERLRATLRVEGFGDAPGELMDLSARGAGVRVAFVEDPNLAEGDHLEILFGQGAGAPVVTPARVMRAEQVGDAHLRYGLEFIDDGSLLPQLDGFYRQFFNRRGRARLPMEDRHLSATITGQSGRHSVSLGDLSEAGLGLFASPYAPLSLRPGQRVTFSFRLPGNTAPFQGIGVVRYFAKLADRKMFGLEYVEDERFTSRLDELRAYVARRAAQVEECERAWSSAADGGGGARPE